VLEEHDVEGNRQTYRLRFQKNTNRMFVLRLLSLRITLYLRRFYSFITIGITPYKNKYEGRYIRTAEGPGNWSTPNIYLVSSRLQRNVR